MSRPPDADTTLEHYPWIIVRFRCRRCRRYADARLARLAEKFGSAETIGGLVERFLSSCPGRWLRRTDGRRILADDLPCGGYCPDLGSTKPPDLPPTMMAFSLIEGGKDDMLPAEPERRERRRRVGGD